MLQDLEALCGHTPDRHVSVAAAMERIQAYQTRLMRKSLAHWQQQLQRIDGFSDTLFSLARTVMSAALEAAMDERDAWHRDKAGLCLFRKAVLVCKVLLCPAHSWQLQQEDRQLPRPHLLA